MTQTHDSEALRVFDDVVNDYGIPADGQRIQRIREALVRAAAIAAMSTGSCATPQLAALLSRVREG